MVYIFRRKVHGEKSNNNNKKNILSESFKLMKSFKGIHIKENAKYVFTFSKQKSVEHFSNHLYSGRFGDVLNNGSNFSVHQCRFTLGQHTVILIKIWSRCHLWLAIGKLLYNVMLLQSIERMTDLLMFPPPLPFFSFPFL